MKTAMRFIMHTWNNNRCSEQIISNINEYSKSTTLIKG